MELLEKCDSENEQNDIGILTCTSLVLNKVFLDCNLKVASGFIFC